jgi:hypothetical protein
LQAIGAEVAAARLLDAEDATMRHVLGWAVQHDRASALRLAVAEAVDGGHRSLALARELGYPAGEALALYGLAVAAHHAGDRGDAVRLARQAQQISADIPGWRARECSSTLTTVLTAAGDLTAAEGICAAGLAGSREAGDLENLAELLTAMADLDLRAGRAERLGRAIDDVSTTVGGLPLLSQDRVWDRVRRVGLDELLQFDWTMVGESDALAAALAACGVLDEIDVGAAEESIKRLREAIGDRCRYLEILA